MSSACGRAQASPSQVLKPNLRGSSTLPDRLPRLLEVFWDARHCRFGAGALLGNFCLPYNLGGDMKKNFAVVASLLVFSIGLATSSAFADDRRDNPALTIGSGPALPFAVLPAGATGPEGLTVGPEGNVYVTTFGFSATGAATGNGQLYVFDDNDGRLLRQVHIQGSTA